MNKTKIDLDSIYGYACEKEKLKKIIDELNKIKTDNTKTTIYKSVIFCGPKGNGKHLFAQVLENETNCPLYELSLNDNCDEDFITNVFSEAADNKPSIIVIDGIDNLIKSNLLDNKKHKALFTLTNLLLYKNNNGIMTILNTDNLDSLPKIYLGNNKNKPVINLNNPSLKSRYNIISKYIAQTTFSFEPKVSFMAKATKDFSVEEILVLLDTCMTFSSKDNIVSIKVFIEQLNNIKSFNFIIESDYKKDYAIAIQELGKLFVARHFKKGIYEINIDRNEPSSGSIFNNDILNEIGPCKDEYDDYYETRLNSVLFFSRDDFEKIIMANIGKEIASDLILNNNYSNLYYDHLDLYSKIKYAVTNGLYGIKFANDYSYDFNTLRGRKTEEKIDQVINDLYERTEKIVKEYLPLITTLANLLVKKRQMDDKEIEPIIIDWFKNNQ